MKKKINLVFSVFLIIAVVSCGILYSIINDADEIITIISDIKNSDNENMTGTSFSIFNNSTVQHFLENISIPEYNPVPYPRSGMEALYGSNTNTQVSVPTYYCDAAMVGSYSKSGTIGFSVGGAKDINNFRENIRWGYLPLVTDITYEGLFYDYFFDTGEQSACDELFCPSYSYAITINPLTGEKEYYLTVGLNSGIQQSEFHRKKLNLVIVLDISGSMGSAFNRYYYNGVEYVEPENCESDWNKSKIEIARESIVSLLGHLDKDDSLGIVLFNGNSMVMEEFSLIKNKDMSDLKKRILKISSDGSTNMDAGMQKATKMLQNFKNTDSSEYENRILFLTDAQPNTGDISEKGLLGQMKQNSDDRIYTSFIGIGVDFNSELIEHITKTRGANYYSVHSSSDFKQRMDDEFEYMVTPLVFDLKMNLISDGYKIIDVFGSPDANESTGELMKVSTLFPSAKMDNETKGGIIVLQLEKLSSNATLNLKVSYEDCEGNIYNNYGDVRIEEQEPDYFQNSGIRKGILLIRYVTLIKKWIAFQRNQTESPYVGQWERKSLTLRVSDEFKQIFSKFADYFMLEMKDIDDESLQQELDILKQLSSLDVTETKLTEVNNYEIICVESSSLLNVTLVTEDGLSWKIKDHDDSIVYLTESYSWNKTDTEQTDMKTWLFRADNTGNTTLVIECIPDGYDGYSYVNTFSITVEVS